MISLPCPNLFCVVNAFAVEKAVAERLKQIEEEDVIQEITEADTIDVPSACHGPDDYFS